MPPLCEIKVLSKNLPQTGCRPCARSKFCLRTRRKQDAALVRDQSFVQELAANRMPPLCEIKVLSKNSPQTGCRPCARSKFCQLTRRKQDAALVIKVLSKNSPQTGCRSCARSKFCLRTRRKQDAALGGSARIEAIAFAFLSDF